MGDYNGANYVDINEVPSPRLHDFKKVSVLPLVFLIFYEVSGGPFGVEDSVQAAGPLLALLGFLVFPIIWSIPEALITAEMGTMFPENGGYVVWVSSALGPYWGFQQGWMKWLSGVIDNALYPVLFLDYLKSGIPALGGGIPRAAAALVLTFVLTYMNYRGLTIVGWAAVLLGIFSILPFVVMGLVAMPKLDPSRWFMVNLRDVDWNLYLNTLFWNLNYWDSISTLAGELPRDCSSREFLVLFWNDIGVYSVCTAKDKYPDAPRPYKIPVGTIGAILMCIPPTILIFVVLALSTFKVMVVSLIAVAIGLVLRPCLKFVERKRWMKFSESADLPDLHMLIRRAFIPW
ncbi:hypothetical protein GH714_022800 [Hevea brasiliensis]|uniref:Amino acid permease/ SLC12A domain-containing protein n=1 Tax=Hevea brasiliensis TaxID=3981 RepID=A0A6A6M8N7_HEVBR|nr:hypothetical protein GH714_022800 [Hevea brasiliensis]